MPPSSIRFEDGAAYERGMGVWSRLAGEVFLDWLRPAAGLRWLDVGCGNGAFTEMLAERCAPSELHGIDPSEAQLAFARTRADGQHAQYRQADSMALPYSSTYFDIAAMALVIFFVPEPGRAIAEMARVVRPGGLVASYSWDFFDAGFPYEPIQAEMRAVGMTPTLPPSVEASRIEALYRLWSEAGLTDIQTHIITVRRSFTNFEDFWVASTGTGSLGPLLAGMPEADRDALKSRVRLRLPDDAEGRTTYAARANAIRGRVPAT